MFSRESVKLFYHQSRVRDFVEVMKSLQHQHFLHLHDLLAAV